MLLLKRVEATRTDLSIAGRRIDEELTAQLSKWKTHSRVANRSTARRLLGKIDARYGGLAAPRSVELAAIDESRRPEVPTAQGEVSCASVRSGW